MSLFADVTYEGAHSVNGPFLATLGTRAAVVGIVSGAGELAGKAIRSPARDVTLFQASKIVGRGWGFGLHEFMDQLGPGPIVGRVSSPDRTTTHKPMRWLPFPPAAPLPACSRLSNSIPTHRASRNPKATGITTSALPRAFRIYMASAGLLAAGFVDFPLIAFHFHKTPLATPGEIPVFYAAAMGVQAHSSFIWEAVDRIGMPALTMGVVLSAASSPLAFFGSFYVVRGSSVIGILYGRSLGGAVTFTVGTQLAAIPLLLMVRRRPA